MTRPKSIILRVGTMCNSNNTMIVKLNNYNGNYAGLLHITDKELQAQFRSGNINKIALIKDKDFILGNNYLENKED